MTREELLLLDPLTEHKSAEAALPSKYQGEKVIYVHQHPKGGPPSPADLYRFMGLRTSVGRVFSNMEKTYQTGSTGDAGDIYTGLDRFGRLVETIFKYSAAGGADLVHSRYGRNRAGGLVWRRDVQAHAASVTTQDTYYLYDGLQQVTSYKRGNLVAATPPATGYTGIAASPTPQTEAFGYDEMGNWNSYTTANPALTQTRTHNLGNELIDITGPTGAIDPTYDGVGNTTLMPKVAAASADWTTGQTVKWDPWGRIVEIRDTSGNLIGSCAYDAIYRRISRPTATETRNYYYDSQWRPVEEFWGTGTHYAFTWAPSDRWTLIRRDYTAGGGATYSFEDGLDVVATYSNTALAISERFRYDAFGNLSRMNASFVASTVGPNPGEFLFHREFMDSDTGLSNYGFRYYHSGLGRWLSRDPIGIEGGVNLYAFVENRPMNYLDFLGMAGRVGTCEIQIVGGHSGQVSNREGQFNLKNDDEKKTPPCMRGEFLGAACKRSEAGGHYLWPTNKAKETALKDPNSKWHNFVTKDDMILGDLLCKLIKQAEEDAKKMCEDKTKCCSEVKITVNCLADPGGDMDTGSMSQARQNDEKAQEACNYKKTIPCKRK